MEHVWATCDAECNGCALCHGGLGLCKVCGGLEGSLTTTCSGRQMSEEMLNMVYAGRLDFKDETWIEAASPASPAVYRPVHTEETP